jgi:hypothetical protein
LILGNYVFVVLSSVLQLMTLGSFALSAFPGGNSSLKGEPEACAARMCCMPVLTLSLCILRRSFRRAVLEVGTRHAPGDRSPLSVNIWDVSDEGREGIGTAP